MIEVLPHDPKWLLQFQEIKEKIWPALGKVALGIEHVGSTSIAGLYAKPVIDIAVVVEDSKKTELAILRLAQLGYQHRGDLGVKGREAFKRPEGSIRHNLYVALNDGLSLRNHLMFKRYLIEHADAKTEYSRLKLHLAKKFAMDLDHYCEAKTDFIVGVLEKAGLSVEELLEIKLANQVKP